MPKNKAQGVIFGILMSITMAYGMEVYNVAWKMGRSEEHTSELQSH